MREVPLVNSDLIALVDDEDFELVSRYRWYVLQPRETGVVYAITAYKTSDGWQRARMHRMILGPGCPPVIDHRDGNGLNNRRANLRPATNSQNMCNRGPNCGRKFKGVRWHKRDKKWEAQIWKDYRNVSLGYFATDEEAARAYDRRARELHGEFAYLNFPG